MRNGFKFKDKHSSQFGVTVKTKSRPIIPKAKTHIVDLPYRDGSYDFSEANYTGREYFEDRIFVMTLGVVADNLIELQRSLSQLSLWLTGRGDLIFDDMPNTVWNGKISDEIIYMPEQGGKSAVLEISIRVSPFPKCIFGTEGPVLDTNMGIDCSIPISIEDVMYYELSGNGNILIWNFGERPMRPCMHIQRGDTITLELDGKMLSFDSQRNCIVDFEKHSVIAYEKNVDVKGEFFEFMPGENIMSVKNSGTSKIKIDVSYTPEFQYGVNTDLIEWGDNNA